MKPYAPPHLASGPHPSTHPTPPTPPTHPPTRPPTCPPFGRALQQSFERGLVQAARSGHSWIVSGGTNTGVMALAGQALSEHKVTAVGFAPWGATLGREQLDDAPVGVADANFFAPETSGAVGETASEYSAHQRPNRPDGAAAEPNHSNFVFVDDGNVGGKAWGAEISMRALVEKVLSERYSVPLVLVVAEVSAASSSCVVTCPHRQPSAAVGNRRQPSVVVGSHL